LHFGGIASGKVRRLVDSPPYLRDVFCDRHRKIRPQRTKSRTQETIPLFSVKLGALCCESVV
jgi:hypothetical protein